MVLPVGIEVSLHGSYCQQAWCEGVSLVGIEAPGRAKGRRMSGMMVCQVSGPTGRWGLRRGEIEALLALVTVGSEARGPAPPARGGPLGWDRRAVGFSWVLYFPFWFFSSGKWNSASLLLVARIHPWR